MQIKVIRPGLFTTIQDAGRYGFQKYGVIVSGAMDTYALRLGNILIGNAPEEGALEITVMGPQLEFTADALVAITGGDLLPQIDGVTVPMWRPVLIKAGSILEFGGCSCGCRAYLAVAGGFDVPRVMASKSTYCKAGFGGWQGRALVAGDVLPVSPSAQFNKYRKVWAADDGKPFLTTAWYAGRSYIQTENPVIRFVPGSQYALFDENSKAAFHHEKFTVTMQSDRMGYRLQGTALKLAAPKELISEAVGFGSVQVPPDGNPIILLADRQTAGGYSKIAQIIQVDLPVLAQILPGTDLRFQEISYGEAEEKLIAQTLELRKIAAAISETIA